MILRMVLWAAVWMAPWLAPRPVVAWETILDAGMATDDYWNAVTVDRVGDVVAAGVSLDQTYDFDCTFSVAKLSRASGAIIWRYDTIDCGYDEVFESSGGEEVMVDAVGDVVVGRRIIGDRGFGVYKLDGASGTLLWAVRAGDYPKHGPFVHAIALDPRGNVVTAAGLGRHGCHTDFVVSKLDAATGAELWRRTLRGTFAYDNECEDGAFNQARSVAVDAAGDVLVSGWLVNEREGSRIPENRTVLLKLSGADGAELWRHDSDTYRDLGPSSVAVDSRGNVLTTWPHLSDSGPDATSVVTVEKRSGDDGRRLWRASFAGGGGGISIDGNDDVAARWITRTSSGRSATLVVKLEGANGAERWRREVEVRALRRMESDRAGNVVLGGAVKQTDIVTDLFVAELAASDGAERWRYVLDGGAHLTDEVRGLAVDGGDVVAVGSWEDSLADIDGIAVLLDGASGGEVWRASAPGRLPTEDGALAVALDAAGDVVAGGFEETLWGNGFLSRMGMLWQSIRSFTVKKLSGASGRVLWSRVEADLPPVSDLVVDGAGDILAAGTSYNPLEANVAKLAGTDGATLWSHPLERHLAPVAVRVLPADDDVIFAAGEPRSGPWTTTLVRLAASDGRELWRRSFDAFPAFGLDSDAAGDVVLVNGFTQESSLIIKVAGSTGEDLWYAAGPGNAAAPVVDAAGDVLVAGSMFDGSGLRHGVVRLDGASGAERWRTLFGDGVAVTVAIDAAGDVLAVDNAFHPVPEGENGPPAPEFTVTKLAGASGAVVWERRVTDGCGAADLAIDAAGDVVVAACPPGELHDGGARLAAVKIDGVDGSVRWTRQRVLGPLAHFFYPYDTGASAVVLGADGNLTVAGISATGPAETALDFAVLHWDGETGADCCQPLPPPAGCVEGAACVPADSCVTAGRCLGGACLPVAASAAEIACGLDALVTQPCGDAEKLPRRLRKLVRKRVKRAARYLAGAERASAGGKQGKGIGLRDRAGAELEAISRAATRAAVARRRQRQISGACRESIVALTTDHRRLIATLGSLGF